MGMKIGCSGEGDGSSCSEVEGCEVTVAGILGAEIWKW